jgi:hypothetical protein
MAANVKKTVSKEAAADSSSEAFQAFLSSRGWQRQIEPGNPAFVCIRTKERIVVLPDGTVSYNENPSELKTKKWWQRPIAQLWPNRCDYLIRTEAKAGS